MREGWRRSDAALAPTQAELGRIVALLMPAAMVARAVPASGGLANTNLRVVLQQADPGQAVPRMALLRFWQRDPAAADREVALLRRLSVGLPVPRVLGFVPADPVFGLPCALLRWMEGQRLDRALASAPQAAAALGEAAGRSLARIHDVTFANQGFFDASLAVAQHGPAGAAGLETWLRTCLGREPGASRLGAAAAGAVLAMVARDGHLLDDPWFVQPCLTHADFNPSNILVARAGEEWQLTAVLDWEFAFVGGPAFDLANLLRPPAGTMAGFDEGVVRGYRAGGGRLPEGWRRMAALADLYSWADFLARPNSGAELVRDARAMVLRIAAGASVGGA